MMFHSLALRVKALPCRRPAALALLAACLATGASAQLKAPVEGRKPAAGITTPSAPPSPAPGPAAPANRAAHKDKESAGQLAAAGWLLLLDRKDWGTAWDTTAAMFRASVPLPAWMDGIPKVREPLGAMVERTPAEVAYRSQLQGRPDGDYVTVIFNTRFERKADAQEVVTTVREADGKWRVTGYVAR